MRKLSHNYSVTYVFLDKNNNSILSYENTACYGNLFRRLTNNNVKNHTLILKDFKCEETVEFHEKYIKKLCELFNFNYELKDDELILTNLQKVFFVKTFVTLFRILFEVYTLSEIKNNINFIKLFLNKKQSEEDIVQHLIRCYNESNINQGSGHGLNPSYGDKKLQNKTKKEFDSFLGNTVQSFFTQVT